MNDLKEALTELGIRLHFYAAEQAESFYFVHATWSVPLTSELIQQFAVVDDLFGGRPPTSCEVRANILYRKPFRKRQSAYALALYRYIPHRYLVVLERDLGAVLARLPEYGYTGREMWLSEAYAAHCHYLAPAHQPTIWFSNEFGVVLHSNMGR